MSKFHWIDDNIKIDFDVPHALKILMNKCEKLDLNEDYNYFDYIDLLDCDMKELVKMGKLTNIEREKINQRYEGGIDEK